MTYKEFLTELHKISKLERQQVSALVSALRRILVDEAISGNVVEIAGLGQFISHKHPEYIQTNDETGETVLYPPRISYRFSAICDSVSADATSILLVEYAGITEEEARLFLDSLAQVISTTVNNGEEIEVNGLGKFVMVDTNQSELRRMALILSDAMKQDVNAPFSYFEPYVITQGISVENKPVEAEVALEQEEESTPETEEAPAVEEPEQEKILPEQKVFRKQEPKKNIWFMAACIAAVVLVALSLTFILKTPSKQKDKTRGNAETIAEVVVPEEVVVEETQIEEDSTVVVAEVAEVQQVVEETPKAVVEEKPKEPAKDATAHRMTDANGTPVTVTLEKGDRLTLVSLRFFGKKEFWPYIFDVNTDKLKSPNNVNVGMRLYLPDPVYFDIDSLSEASLTKAKLRARELSTNN